MQAFNYVQLFALRSTFKKNLTERFTISEPQIQSIDVFELHKIRILGSKFVESEVVKGEGEE